MKKKRKKKSARLLVIQRKPMANFLKRSSQRTLVTEQESPHERGNC